MRLRWDYDRAAWRHVSAAGELMLLWYKACAACGAMESHMGANRALCFRCRRRQCDRIGAIAGPAQRAVMKAIREGRLPRLDGSIPCVDCSAPAAVYDHRDYRRPLDVEPVCRRCNVRRGPAVDVAHLWFKSAPKRTFGVSVGVG